MKALFELFLTFFKIGLFTFGGGYAMIAQFREVAVEKKKWISEDEFFRIITIAEATPGPIAINMATYIGFKRKGVSGSAFATLGVVLPSFIIIYIISFFADAFKQNQYVKYAFAGINSAVAFLILKTGISLLAKIEKKVVPILCFSAVFVLMIVFEVFSVSFSSILFILAGGVIGIFAYSLLDFKVKEKKHQ